MVEKMSFKFTKIPDNRFINANSANSNQVFLLKNHGTQPYIRPMDGWKIIGYGKAPWPGSSDGFAVMFERIKPDDKQDQNSMPEGTWIWQHMRENDYKRCVDRNSEV